MLGPSLPLCVCLSLCLSVSPSPYSLSLPLVLSLSLSSKDLSSWSSADELDTTSGSISPVSGRSTPSRRRSVTYSSPSGVTWCSTRRKMFGTPRKPQTVHHLCPRMQRPVFSSLRPCRVTPSHHPRTSPSHL